jgi:hypothetical protein
VLEAASWAWVPDGAVGVPSRGVTRPSRREELGGVGTEDSTVQTGAREVDEGVEPTDRVRRPGAGRPRLIDKDPELLLELDDLVSPEARGDPCRHCSGARSTYQLADTLKEKGFTISPTVVGELLAAMGYSLQGTSKQKEGRQHVDRDAQFGYINSTAGSFLRAGEPVIVRCRRVAAGGRCRQSDGDRVGRDRRGAECRGRARSPAQGDQAPLRTLRGARPWL